MVAIIEMMVFCAGFLALVPLALAGFFKLGATSSLGLMAAMALSPFLVWTLSVFYWHVFELGKWHVVLTIQLLREWSPTQLQGHRLLARLSLFAARI